MSNNYTSLNNYYNGISEDEWVSGDIEILNMHKKSHSDDVDWDDDMADYDDKQEINELLRDPLTQEERAVYTRRGVRVTIEHRRARSRDPRGRVNIISWTTLHILNQFDSYLRRFGTRAKYYTPFLHWDGQDGPYAIAWEDLISLNVPWNRDGFYIYLAKCTVSRRKRQREYNDDDNDNPKKRRRKNKNSVKNHEMKQSRLALMELLDDKYVNWIRGYKKKRGLVSRLIYLHSREHWDKDMLQRLIFDNYMAFDIKDKINAKHRDLQDVDMNKSEINQLTKSAMNESNEVKLDLRNTGDNKKVEKKFWSTVWDKGFDADLKTIGYNDALDTTNNGHTISNDNDSELLRENDKLKSELDKLKKQLSEIQNANNIMPKIDNVEDID